MCGITGFIQKNPSAANKNKELIQTMTAKINHRGPDDYAEYVDDHCALGMRRLAIVDLTPGLYPMTNDSGDKEMVFNGEIYNFKQVRSELEHHGLHFKTQCDAEIILKGYDLWGNAIFAKLRGMFAIAIWDKKAKKLILVRDRVGIKPIYYLDNKDFFAFASEAKALYSFSKKKLDPIKVTQMTGFMFLPDSENTVISDVKKVPPATILELTYDTMTFTKYWSLENVNENSEISYLDAVEQLDGLLTETFAMHLMSDVPLGLLLSGGIDSSLLAAMLLKKKLAPALNTYTAKFDHKFDESALARETADLLGSNHTEIFVDTSQVNRDIENYAKIFDDLTTFDGGLISTKLLCQAIEQKGIKVLLLGEGSDEIFGGYSWYGLSQMPFSLVPALGRNGLYYYSISRNVTKSFYDHTKFWHTSTPNTTDIFRDITKRELFVQLPNHLLMKVDKGSMSHSIEARVPYLDHILIEYVYSLPQSYKLQGVWFDGKKQNEKRILRDVAAKYLPRNTALRKKKGFMLPMRNVLYSDIAKVKSYLLAQDAVVKPLLGEAFVQSLFNEQVSNLVRMQNEYFLWRLFIFEAWAKKYELAL
jgi:asparagine synthase (glutamine-hydrolysing)